MITGLLIALGVSIAYRGGWSHGRYVRKRHDARELSENIMCVCEHSKNNHKNRGKGSCPVSTKPGYHCSCQRFTPDAEHPQWI